MMTTMILLQLMLKERKLLIEQKIFINYARMEKRGILNIVELQIGIKKLR